MRAQRSSDPLLSLAATPTGPEEQGGDWVAVYSQQDLGPGTVCLNGCAQAKGPGETPET